LVAKQAAQVDVLSGGRLRLGIGIGWNHVEYQTLGYDFHTRGKRVEEQVTLLRELWTKPLVTFDGQFDTIPDAGINPLPIQRPIPIWMGGYVDAVLRRAARLGDGWMPGGAAESNRESLEKLHRYLEAEGRQPESFGIETKLSMGQVPESEWSGWIEAWRDAGASHLAVNTMNMGLGAPADHIEAIRRFKAAI
jgi:probable F420-dependent oxidoreductase